MMRFHVIGERNADDMLHDDERRTVRFAALEDPHDVGMIDARTCDRFRAKSCAYVRIVDQLGPRRLDRDNALDHALNRAVDDTHATDADDIRHHITVGDALAETKGECRVGHDIAQSIGSSKKNREPTPRMLSTPIRPSCASMIRLLTYRPR